MRAVLAMLLVMAPGPGGARASGPGLSEGTDSGELPEGTGAWQLPEGTGDEATRWATEGQQRQARGDLDGALAAWQRALAALPATQATAHRRAGLVLAIAGAHAQRGRLPAALAALDGYLAGLDPTDDEHRVAVEQRRAELAAQLSPPRPTAPVVTGVAAPLERRPDRRLLIAGGAAVGLAAVAGATLGASVVAATRADAALAAAVARPGDDPRREATKDEALARGLRADRDAVVSAAVGGTLLLLGVTLLAVGATRKRPRAAWVPRLANGGLRWRF